MCLLQLPFYDIDDTELLTLNSSELLHECDLNGTRLSYQPYRYADYNVCDLNGTCLSYQPYRYADYNVCDLNGTCLSYQPYRYADYNECDLNGTCHA